MALIEPTLAAIEHIKQREPLLGSQIERLGYLSRERHEDYFGSLMRTVIGQQISGKAAATIWQRVQLLLGVVDAQRVAETSEKELQECGLSFRKVSYMQGIAQAVLDERLKLDMLNQLENQQVITQLTALPGLGIWSAEMFLLFSLGRPDILSWNDLGIRRGMEMLYQLEKISRAQFEHYRQLYSPYGSCASLYLWALAGGKKHQEGPKLFSFSLR